MAEKVMELGYYPSSALMITPGGEVNHRMIHNMKRANYRRQLQMHHFTANRQSLGHETLPEILFPELKKMIEEENNKTIVLDKDKEQKKIQ